MARTNKRGIAAKKAQLEKQAKRLKWGKRFDYPKRKLDLEDAKEMGIIGVHTNPRGREYSWFLKGRKVCWETRLRMDPDGYRYIRTPSGWSEIVEVSMSWWIRNKIRKTLSIKN